MKTLNLITVILFALSLIIIGCEEDETENIKGNDVELYLIESYETTGTIHQIDENSVITNADPLLYYSDFTSYDTNNYLFELSEDGKNRIKNLEHSAAGIPFALKVDNEIIYTGYFLPGYTSLVIDWIVVDPIFVDQYNGIKVELGFSGSEISDRRNDNKILDIFRQDNKLIE